MDENLHNIDDLFKKAINEHSELPSESVWEQIDRNLDKKKVAFISKKYNKLKWIAAALLMFSAGMAMYTWHTKMTNKELVKQNSVIGEKQVSVNKTRISDNNKIDINIALTAKAENKALVKDTAEKIMLKDPTALAETDNTNVFKKEIKNSNNIPITAGKNPEKIRKGSSVSLAKTSDRDKENKERTGKTLAHFNDQDSVKAGINEISKKGIKKMLYDKNNSFNTASQGLLNANKEVAAKTVATSRNLKVQSVNSFTQNFLEKLSGNKDILKIKETAALSSVKISSKVYKKPLFSATVFLSPDLVSKQIDNDHRRFREDDRDEIKNKEEVRSSYSAGILISYNAWKKFSIESGVVYSVLATDIDPKLVYARPDDRGNINYRFNCSTGYSYIPSHSVTSLANGDSASASASKNILNYIAVPLNLKYNAVAGKFSLSPGLGIAFNFLTKGKIETAVKGVNGDEKLNLSHIEGLNSMYVNSAISLGINYGLSKNFALSLTPAARFALTSINKNTPVKTFINSYGLAAGVTIRL